MDKNQLFWCGIFPFILGTFFVMAFSNITETTENMQTMNIFVVADEGSQNNAEELLGAYPAFETFLDTMEEMEYINITMGEYRDSVAQVNDGEADGVIVMEAGEEGLELSLVFAENGINQTILKSIVNTYIHGEDVIMDIIKTNPKSVESAIEQLYNEESINENISVTSEKADPFNQYFFALFSMTCMFGATFGFQNTFHTQADQSAVGKRRTISPAGKFVTVASEFLAAVTLEMLIFTALFFYLTGIMGIDLGSRYLQIFIAAFVATLLGVSYGYLLGVGLKVKLDIKTAICCASVLFMNFLAGLMVSGIKPMIENKCPIINRINPAAIISDSFLSICAFDDMEKYITCIISALVWTAIFMVGSVILLRRERYANL